MRGGDDRTSRQFFTGIAWACVCTLLSAYAKPNFALALIGATPLYLGYLAWQHPLTPGRLYWMALPMLFAFLALALQFVIKFGAPEVADGGIGFGWISVAGARGVNVNPLIGLVQLAAFPIVAVLLLPSIFKDRLYVFSLLLFIVAALQYLLLHETGSRMYDGNFGWGRMIVAPLLFAAALGYVLRLIATSWQSIPMWRSAVLVLIFLSHLDSGIRYLFQLLTQSSYY